MRSVRASLIGAIAVTFLAGQTVTRPKDVREIAKAGSTALPQLQELLKNPDRDVRIEAVKQIIIIGPPRSLDPLIVATLDNDPDVQMLATDGIVNFYMPGYVKTGVTAPLRKVGSSIKGKFTDTNDQVIDAYLTPRADAIAAIGKLVRSGSSMDSRADAARAIGILRGKAAVPDLEDAAHSKNSELIYEALIALQKIRDESAGPHVSFLLHDLDSKVQIAAIETMGLLRNKDAAPALADVLNHSKDAKVKRAALTSLAMLPSEKNRSVYMQYLNDKDDRLRAGAAEGIGRLKNPSDLPTLEKAWQDEAKPQPRLSLAFAMVLDGKTELSEFSPLQFLINNLNSAAYDGEAQPFLVELARDAKVRDALYAPMQAGTKAEKIGLAGVLARSGDAGSVTPLQKLTNDPDPAVAQAALTAVRNLQARM
jgi:HEAT repeat protein